MISLFSPGDAHAVGAEPPRASGIPVNKQVIFSERKERR